MDYRIIGADTKTGQERRLNVSAVDEKAALVASKEQGVLAYSIEEWDDTPPDGGPPTLQPSRTSTTSAGPEQRLVIGVIFALGVLVPMLLVPIGLPVLLAVIIVVVALVLIGIIFAAKAEAEKVAAMSPVEREKYLDEKQKRFGTLMHGQINPAMICPHCQEKGKVRTKHVVQKAGISGGKATGAVLTGGLTLLATGLSRKEDRTQAHCDNCGSSWMF